MKYVLIVWVLYSITSGLMCSHLLHTEIMPPKVYGILCMPNTLDENDALTYRNKILDIRNVPYDKCEESVYVYVCVCVCIHIYIL